MRNGKNGAVEKFKGDAVRYFKNGLEKVRKTPRDNGLYADAKPLQEGIGGVYLGVLKALNSFALTRGYSENKLPKNDQEYRELLRKHAVHNGKLKKALNDVYSYLHLGVYYRDRIDVEYVKYGIAQARFVIEKLTGKKIA